MRSSIALVVSTTAALASVAGNACALEFYVDAATGDDGRSAFEAQAPTAPWATISHALDTVDTSGGRHTIHVQAGTYAESAGSAFGDVELRAMGGAVVMTPPGGSPGLDLTHGDILIEGITIQGGTNGIRARNADGLVIRGCTSEGAASDGMHVETSVGVTIENSQIVSAGGRGLFFDRSSEVYARNNRITSNEDWGIHFNASTGSTSTGNIVAFNTIVGNGWVAPNSGGVRLENASAEIRDNIVVDNTSRGVKSDTAGSLVHHNDVFGSAVAYESSSGNEPIFWSNLAVDPTFVGASDHRLLAGSPAIDAGSEDVANIDISGSATQSGVADTGLADLGFHPDALPSTGTPPMAPAVPGAGEVHYVDCATGSDSHTKSEAQNPATPWATIRYAVLQLGWGEVAEVADGDCHETAAIEIGQAGIVVRAASSLGTTVFPPTGVSAFNVEASHVIVQGFAIETDTRGLLVDSTEPVDLHGVTMRGLHIGPPSGGSLGSDAITIRDTVGAIVENSVLSGGARGVLLQRTQDAYVRNNRISGASDWGIQVDDTSGDGDATGNILAFNTVTGNGDTVAEGGIRFFGATGEARDNIIAFNSGIAVKTDTAPVYVHHNDIFGQPTPFDTKGGHEPTLWENIAIDPLFVGGDQRLSEIAAGDAADSPALDRGSGEVSSVDIDGTTRTDAAADTGLANMGFHHDASPSSDAPPIQTTGGTTYYVDAATGDDARSALEAGNPDTPWQSISRALENGNARAGDTVSVAAGTYAESPSSTTSGVSLQANGIVQITPPAGQSGIQVNHPGFTVEGFTIVGGVHGIRASTADGLVIRNCRVQTPINNGLMVVDTTGATLENNLVDGAGQRGILIKNTDQAYVRNNGVTNSGEWGIQIDSTPGPVSAGNVVAFNTVYGSGASTNAGGIRFEGATGEIRDNVVSTNANIGVKVDTAPTYVHHNTIHGSATEIDTLTGQEPVLFANDPSDPLLVNPAAGDLSLSHVAAGQALDSPAKDQGSGLVAEADISGSTRTDASTDVGVADRGFHTAAGASAGVPPVQTGGSTSYYVDPVGGSNGNSATAAQTPGGAWQTIGYAISQSQPGDILQLQPGTYAEHVSIDTDAVTLRGGGALGTVVIEPPAGQVGISVTDVASVRIENLVIEGGAQGVRADNAPGLRIFGVATTNQSQLGIHVVDTADAWIDSCIVTGAGSHGLSLERSSALYVRNNRVYANAEWGISVDNTLPSDPQPPLSIGNAVAFNTVHQNGDGIRMLNASGEVRDNQITGQVDLGLFLGGAFLIAHHNNFATNARDRDKDASLGALIGVWSNRGKSPKYVDPAGADGLLGGAHWADDDFRLQRLAAGQAHDSPSVDVGSNVAANIDIGGSTSTTGEADTGIADIGYHENAPPGVAIPAFATAPAQSDKTYYTSPLLGDDSRSKAQAQNPATPWETLGHALQQAQEGDTVAALPGLYLEALSVERANLVLISDQPGQAVVRPTSGAAISVSAPGVTIDGFVLRNASTGINVTAGSDNVRITNCAATDSSTNGFRAIDVSGIVIENSVASGSTFSGIQLRRVQGATIQNNLAYANGEWGLSHDNSGNETLSIENLVAHNTFTMNGIGNARLLNAIGLLRDNLLTHSAGRGLRIDTAGVVMLHNGFEANGTPLDPEDYLFCAGCAGNEPVIADYVDPTGTDGILGGNGAADDDFRLSQIAAGQDTQSTAVDFGSDLASTLSVNGSTATTGSIDDGVVDVGYHYDASMSALPSPGYSSLPDDVLYVDVNIGDDGYTRSQATSDLTPWRTLEHALAQVVPGDTLLIAPGVYPESVTVDVQDVRIRGDGAAATTILEPSGPISPPDPDPDVPYNPYPALPHYNGIRVRASGVRIENLWIRGARRAILNQRGADGLSIEDVVVTSSSRDGIAVGSADGIALSRVIVTGSRRYGVYVRKATGFQMRDCDLYANGKSGLGVSLSDGTVTFVTAYGNREGARAARSALTVRDSIFAGNDHYGFRARSNDPITLDHTLFGLNGRGDLSPTSLAVPSVQTSTDPLLVDPAGLDTRLGGEFWQDDDLNLTLASPAVDAGSDLASNLGVTGSATGGPVDTGTADLGAHR